MFQFVGCNDADCRRDSTWHVLCENRSGKSPQSPTEVRQCEVDLEAVSRVGYRCLGLKILKVGAGKYAALTTIRMWESFSMGANWALEYGSFLLHKKE